jgi:hypothetical protein
VRHWPRSLPDSPSRIKSSRRAGRVVVQHSDWWACQPTSEADRTQLLESKRLVKGAEVSGHVGDSKDEESRWPNVEF